jgi:hypothetical protein
MRRASWYPSVGQSPDYTIPAAGNWMSRNVFLVFATVSFTALVSGPNFGWESFNLVTLPALVIAIAGIGALYALSHKRAIAI